MPCSKSGVELPSFSLEQRCAAIRCATQVGHRCHDTPQECIVLSDTLELSQRVVAQHHRRPAGVTEQTACGPLPLNDAPALPQGAESAAGVAGEPCVVSARVPNTHGQCRVWCDRG